MTDSITLALAAAMLAIMIAATVRIFRTGKSAFVRRNITVNFSAKEAPPDLQSMITVTDQSGAGGNPVYYRDLVTFIRDGIASGLIQISPEEFAQIIEAYQRASLASGQNNIPGGTTPAPSSNILPQSKSPQLVG